MEESLADNCALAESHDILGGWQAARILDISESRFSALENRREFSLQYGWRMQQKF